MKSSEGSSSTTRSGNSINVVHSAHRGYGASSIQDQYPIRYPENTIISFHKVMEAGADSIEFDVYRSNDKKIMVVHDNDLSINANFIVYTGEEILDGKGGKLPVGSSPIPPGTHFVEKMTSDEIKKRCDMTKGGGVAPAVPENEKRYYTQMPELTEVLELVSNHNEKRASTTGLPSKNRIKLNIELKGDKTGVNVQKTIDDYNEKQSGARKIRQEEIYYMSFSTKELARIAGSAVSDEGKESELARAPAPKANLVLGVTTSQQYAKVDEGDQFSILDPNLDKDKLNKPGGVRDLNDHLKNLPGREGKGLTGVDMSLWDISDKSIEYFCKDLQIPIHIMVPYGPKHLSAVPEIQEGLGNIRKIVDAQNKALLKPDEVTILIKSNDPIVLRKELERHEQVRMGSIISANIRAGNVAQGQQQAQHEELQLLPKPFTRHAEKIKREKISLKSKSLRKSLENSKPDNKGFAERSKIDREKVIKKKRDEYWGVEPMMR